MTSLPPTGNDLERLRDALRRAVDFRGDVTIELVGGERIEGFAFDLRTPPAGRAELRILPTSGETGISIPIDAIAAVEFTGKDAASGKSWEGWIRRYAEKRLAGEAASIESEPLDEPVRPTDRDRA